MNGKVISLIILIIVLAVYVAWWLVVAIAVVIAVFLIILIKGDTDSDKVRQRASQSMALKQKNPSISVTSSPAACMKPKTENISTNSNKRSDYNAYYMFPVLNFEALDTILIKSLSHKYSLFVDMRHDKEKSLRKKRVSVFYELHSLQSPKAPNLLEPSKFPVKPDSSKYLISESWLMKIFPSIRKSKEAKLQEKFSNDMTEYDEQCRKIAEDNERIANKNQVYTKDYEKESAQYQNRKTELEHEIEAIDMQLEGLDKREEAIKAKLIKGEAETLEEYAGLLLEHSEYPFDWNREISVAVEKDTLVVNYGLPTIKELPPLAHMKIVRGKEKAVTLTDKELDAKYESVLYQIILRTINEIFSDEYLVPINYVVINGLLEILDKSKGLKSVKCIMSLAVSRARYEEINFSAVDPKECFRGLKGISARSLSTLTPVKPIKVLNKEDSRFIDAESVAVDESTNLAAMDWEDFEQLVRELFEKEFVANGGECKVTRASRDGGIDAVAFDPDPIRGGKTVIQAKRYTNTVDVDAVRALYGAIMNEGASRGILVTTSGFGGDSYEFAKGKPITLLDGQNLLYLLEKHGYHARIDIPDAKRIQRQNQ